MDRPTYRVALEGGPFASTLWGLSWFGPHISGALVRERSPTAALVFGASADVGEMPGGLATGDAKAFFGWERIYDRLRLGIAGGLAVFWMSRIRSDNAGPIFALGFVGRGLFSFDLVRLDETRALYVAAVPELEILRGVRSGLLHGDVGFLLRASACVGARF